MMWIISGRLGIVVWYVRLMFCTPSPTLETSRLPSLRRPLRAGAAGVLGASSRCEGAGAAERPRSGTAASAPADRRKVRRPVSCFRFDAMGAMWQMT
jgi:hypothetical protein